MHLALVLACLYYSLASIIPLFPKWPSSLSWMQHVASQITAGGSDTPTLSREEGSPRRPGWSILGSLWSTITPGVPADCSSTRLLIFLFQKWDNSIADMKMQFSLNNGRSWKKERIMKSVKRFSWRTTELRHDDCIMTLANVINNPGAKALIFLACWTPASFSNRPWNNLQL